MDHTHHTRQQAAATQAQKSATDENPTQQAKKNQPGIIDMTRSFGDGYEDFLETHEHSLFLKTGVPVKSMRNSEMVFKDTPKEMLSSTIDPVMNILPKRTRLPCKSHTVAPVRQTEAQMESDFMTHVKERKGMTKTWVHGAITTHAQGLAYDHYEPTVEQYTPWESVKEAQPTCILDVDFTDADVPASISDTDIQEAVNARRDSGIDTVMKETCIEAGVWADDQVQDLPIVTRHPANAALFKAMHSTDENAIGVLMESDILSSFDDNITPQFCGFISIRRSNGMFGTHLRYRWIDWLVPGVSVEEGMLDAQTASFFDDLAGYQLACEGEVAMRETIAAPLELTPIVTETGTRDGDDAIGQHDSVSTIEYALDGSVIYGHSLDNAPLSSYESSVCSQPDEELTLKTTSDLSMIAAETIHKENSAIEALYSIFAEADRVERNIPLMQAIVNFHEAVEATILPFVTRRTANTAIHEAFVDYRTDPNALTKLFDTGILVTFSDKMGSLFCTFVQKRRAEGLFEESVKLVEWDDRTELFFKELGEYQMFCEDATAMVDTRFNMVDTRFNVVDAAMFDDKACESGQWIIFAPLEVSSTPIVAEPDDTALIPMVEDVDETVVASTVTFTECEAVQTIESVPLKISTESAVIGVECVAINSEAVISNVSGEEGSVEVRKSTPYPGMLSASVESEAIAAKRIFSTPASGLSALFNAGTPLSPPTRISKKRSVADYESDLAVTKKTRVRFNVDYVATFPNRYHRACERKINKKYRVVKRAGMKVAGEAKLKDMKMVEVDDEMECDDEMDCSE